MVQRPGWQYAVGFTARLSDGSKAIGQGLFAGAADHGAVVFAEEYAQARGVHSAGAQQVSKRLGWNVRDSQVPEQAHGLPADGLGRDTVHVNLGDIDASPERERFTASGDVQDGQAWIGGLAGQDV